MLRIALALAVFVCLSTVSLAERRVALVFGVDDYRALRPLANAVNDARAVEDALKALEFEVYSEHNRDLRRMRRALEDFAEDAAGADVALVFFAGHGIEVAGVNRLLPSDTDISSLERLAETSLTLEEVRQTVAAVAPIGLIILDACRDDPFGLSSSPGDGRGAERLSPPVARAARPGLGRMGRAENVLFAFAAAPGETAADGSGANSPFTTALTKYLPTDGIEIRSVLTLVQQEVYDFSAGRQLPYVESGLPATFFAAAAGNLPERERLLLAMADVTPSIRDEIERVATANDMPLAPLYAALVSENLSRLSVRERGAKLAESAAAFARVRDELRTLSSTDPQVMAFRAQAEEQLALGAIDAALARLDQAASVDAASRHRLMANYVERTLSEAATHYLSGAAASTDLRYDRAVADLLRADALYTEVSHHEMPDRDRQRRLLSLEALSDIYRVLGDTINEQDASSRMHEILLNLPDNDFDNPHWLRQLGVSYNRMTVLLRRQGDEYGANQAVLGGLSVRSALVAMDPENAEWQWDLAKTHNVYGNFLLDAGRLPDALKSFRTGFEIVTRLSAAYPSHTGFQRSIAVAQNGIGDVLTKSGDLEGALEAFTTTLAIAERLAAEDPNNPEAQNDVSASLDRIGGVLRHNGDLTGAKEAYQRMLSISQRLAADDPRNVERQSDISLILGRIGDVRRAQGNRDGALDAYRDALAINKRLAANDPGSAFHQRSLIVSYVKLATSGDDPQGRYRKALAVAEALESNGQLSYSDEWMVDDLRKRLASAELASQSE